MLKTVTGIYDKGQIIIEQYPDNIQEETPVTFLETQNIDLKSRGINQEETENIREKLAVFADEWNREEMNIYDNYEQYKNELKSR
ncbi:hypothetical protein ACN4EE_19490 [Geminocystis sp. CENA526]|uniref:hypothetical protein n=1 Tax=Geminocystis sp. CENA526 TaxID=1355871 RepID=UPI003D6FAAD1